ncbi:Hypothetical protein MVR_LOCUS179 [uncultured virus]|nr:Hypothetical protein MVR_LOCUS179 [uncultured virus]
MITLVIATGIRDALVMLKRAEPTSRGLWIMVELATFPMMVMLVVRFIATPVMVIGVTLRKMVEPGLALAVTTAALRVPGRPVSVVLVTLIFI